jgi:hypothetical protein
LLRGCELPLFRFWMLELRTTGIEWLGSLSGWSRSARLRDRCA